MRKTNLYLKIFMLLTMNFFRIGLEYNENAPNCTMA